MSAMDPFARKMIFGALAFGGTMLLMAAVLSAIYYHSRPLCSEAVVSETASPDGKWIVAVMERRCGEESPLYMHINLRGAGDALRLAYFSGRCEAGEIFVAEEGTHDRAAMAEWNSASQLTIRCPGCRSELVRKRQMHWGAIAVQYVFP
jgi:hypothetical protein